MLHACEIAFQGGWNNVKLYFMIGLPTETTEDLDGIAEVCKKVAYCWRMNTNNRARGVRITASASCFVPKPQTPFQWDAQDTLDQLREKQAYMKTIMKNQECHLQLARRRNLGARGRDCPRRPPAGQGDLPGLAARLQDGRLGSVL